MHIICLTPLKEGVYNDNNSDNITAPPEGWAYIPEDFSLPSTFPRLGSLEAAELPCIFEVEVEKDGKTVTEQHTKMMMTVTAMTEGVLPESIPEEVTTEDLLLEMAADHEYRISLIEMGVSDFDM